MTKMEKTNLFKTYKPQADTRMDKTTRAVREILNGETEQREAKTARLRKARLEKEASPPVKVIAPTTNGARNKPRVHAIT